MWNSLTKQLLFTGVSDSTVWQDIIFSSVFIPIAISLYKYITDYWNKKRPLNLLLNGFSDSRNSVLVFLSQLHSCDIQGNHILGQKYIIFTPNPIPGAKNVMRSHMRRNIDPVWSEGDGECLADIYNVFGKSNLGENIRIADTISDWGEWAKPIISIGFNPKTEKLMQKCEPIYFKIDNAKLSILESEVTLDSVLPNDAGIIQKTFLKNPRVPVFILAGLGTLGTSAAGYFFKKECVNLGKLYGSESFCVLFSVKTDEGRTAAFPVSIYPKPTIINRLFHPILYYKWRLLFQNEMPLPT